ncbi:MAG: hypothetical protein H0V45_00495 [Actinobacteria bacterium]|nr:hypothetical protein [Actinomycetota bacterium]
MLKVEVILGIVASSIAILAFFARAVANVRRGRRERERQESHRQESQRGRQIPPGE